MALALTLAGSLAAGGANAADLTDAGLRRLDTRLAAAAASADPLPQRVIIRVRPGARAAMRQTLQGHGDAVLAEHASLDALTAVVHGGDLARLAQQADVLSISTDAPVGASGQLLGGLLGGVLNTVGTVVNTAGGLVGGLTKTVTGILDPGTSTAGPPVSPQLLRDTLGLGSTWTGRSVTVAVVDSGLEMSSEFQGRVKAFYDFTGGKSAAATPSDEYGHGTHVAGIIGGSGALSYNRAYHGLAPNVSFVALKVLDATGAGLTSDVIRAIDFAVANRAKYGIDILNLSLGHPIYEPAATDPLVQAVERASKAGIIVIAAAGNLGENPTTGTPGYGGITSPGNAPSALTVGAVQTLDTVTRGDDRIPDYSSSGPTWYDAIVKPDLLAPGHNIVAVAAKKSQIYAKYPQLRAADADYIRLSGTSMATAVASGVVALVLEAHDAAAAYGAPPMAPNTIKGILEYTAVDVRNDLAVEYDVLRQGAGALNGKGAISLARAVDTTAQPGTPWLNPNPAPYSTIGSETLAWKQAVIWGDAVIWGETLPTNQLAWGSAVIWGENITWSDAVIWGESEVWSDPQSWGSAVIWGEAAIGTTDGSAVIWGETNGMTEASTAWKDIDPATP
jgi:serine protease AprX